MQNAECDFHIHFAFCILHYAFPRRISCVGDAFCKSESAPAFCCCRDVFGCWGGGRCVCPSCWRRLCMNAGISRPSGCWIFPRRPWNSGPLARASGPSFPAGVGRLWRLPPVRASTCCWRRYFGGPGLSSACAIWPWAWEICCPFQSGMEEGWSKR